MRPKHSDFELTQNATNITNTNTDNELNMNLSEQMLYNSASDNNKDIIKTPITHEEEEEEKYKEYDIELISNNNTANANNNTYKNILNYQLNSNSNASNSRNKTKKEAKWTNYRICTWNLWCIPVGSPRTLSNPDRCSSYMRDLADREQWSEYNGLIIVALQELWCWKTGIFPPFLLRLVALFEYIPYIGICLYTHVYTFHYCFASYFVLFFKTFLIFIHRPFCKCFLPNIIILLGCTPHPKMSANHL